MSGRTEQLARQIRRLRTSASEPTRTLQRAIHLAADLAQEHGGDFAHLASQNLIDAALAERLTALEADASAVTDQHLVDLDVFLRSIENGAPAQPLALAPLHGSPKPPPGTHRASVNVSGRVVTVEGREGSAIITVDDTLIAGSFALESVPLSHYDVTRTTDGTITIQWPGLLRVTVAPDFASATAQVLNV